MSVTFVPRRADGAAIPGRKHPASCCLCAQFAPTWNGLSLDGVDVTELAGAANPGCARCEGTGLEQGWTEDLSLNLNEENGHALLALLGMAVVIAPGQNVEALAPLVLAQAADEAGCMTLPLARRCVMAARARFERLAPMLARAELALYGAPQALEDGVVEARPLRAWSPAFDAEDLRERLEAFASLVEEGARAGAVDVYWS